MSKTSSKALIVELSEFSLLVARVSSLEHPMVLEGLEEIPLSDGEASIRSTILSMVGNPKIQYAYAACGIYPPTRVIRRATLENPAKTKDPAYLPEFLKSQFKIDVASYAMSVLNASGGGEFGSDKTAGKELVFSGAPRAALRAEQERLVSYGIFPTRVDIASVSTVGAVLDYQQMKGEKSPTLILEMGYDEALVLVCNGKSLDVARPVPYGLRSMYPIVQKELGLKDEESAQKLFGSSTFDFAEMGPTLLKKLLKELQASTGFYEVQTGQTIGNIFLGLVPDNLGWIATTLSKTLGVHVLKPDYEAWLEHQGIKVADGVDLGNLGSRWFGLFSLMGNYSQKS
ncbi:hypothetical protein [Cerasicoccus arenae]|uniref:Uncharacterized protein n=1 Tax=Cerasicoccus arenae TaxID=424488 RepID=A0A8J3D9Q1_9BACT|nr:hypothetical protein [Cerasicoccus arenae]MBK1859309.1 hypothetical protein [Cerasicoccus arenae]GHB94246.1 hypothetical protein GCM10007047_07400 [Cerasicoccus arenae]